MTTHFDAWIGRRESMTDTLDAKRRNALASATGAEMPEFAPRHADRSVR